MTKILKVFTVLVAVMALTTSCFKDSCYEIYTVGIISGTSTAEFENPASKQKVENYFYSKGFKRETRVEASSPYECDVKAITDFSKLAKEIVDTDIKEVCGLADTDKFSFSLATLIDGQVVVLVEYRYNMPIPE